MDVPVIETAAQKRKRRAKKLALNLFFAVAAYALLVVAARLLHRRVLYQPPTAQEGDPSSLPPPEGVTLLTARTADGIEAHALEIAPPEPGARAPMPPPVRGRNAPPPHAAPAAPAHDARFVVLFHGNAETADDNVAFARELRRRGFGVVLAEYRGYGRSRGASPTEEGLYLDALAILDLLAARGVDRERIVLWGQSLGSGVAVEMAKRGRGGRLVLVAPFASAVELAQRVVPVLPASLVMVDRFDSVAKAKDVTTPAFVVHGDIDDVIPLAHGQRLANALPHATFLAVPEGRHDNLYRNASVVQALVAHAAGAGS